MTRAQRFTSFAESPLGTWSLTSELGIRGTNVKKIRTINWLVTCAPVTYVCVKYRAASGLALEGPSSDFPFPVRHIGSSSNTPSLDGDVFVGKYSSPLHSDSPNLDGLGVSPPIDATKAFSTVWRKGTRRAYWYSRDECAEQEEERDI